MDEVKGMIKQALEERTEIVRIQKIKALKKDLQEKT